MKIYDACSLIFKDIKETPVRQKDIVKRLVELTGYSYESCRANVFRSKKLTPFVYTDFIKVKDSEGYVAYIKGKTKYNQNYNKPKEYFELLSSFNNYDTIYTLSGTHSHCLNVLDKDKTIRVDNNKMIDSDLSCDIFSIKHDEKTAFNLDFEGIITRKKVIKINKMKCSEILLTLRLSKNTDMLLNDIITYDILNKYTYKSGRDTMMICKLKRKP